MRCESCLLEGTTGLALPAAELLERLADCDDCPLTAGSACSVERGGLLIARLRDAAQLLAQQQGQLKKARNEAREMHKLASHAAERIEKLEQLQQAASRETDDELRAKMDLVARQQAAILALSTPIIQVQEGVLVLPLIGALDDERAANLKVSLLEEVQRERARFAILDLTGVPAVDQRTARLFLMLAGAVQLLGARALLSGIRPQVARELCGLGLEIGDLLTTRCLQDALRYCSQQLSAR